MKYLNTFGGRKGGGTKGGANPKPPGGRNPRPPSGGRGSKFTRAGVKKGPPGMRPTTKSKTARDIRRESISSILKDVNRSKPATKTKNRATSAIRAKAAIMSTQTKREKLPSGTRGGPVARKEKLPSGTRGGPVAKNQTARGLRRESISSILKDVNRSKRTSNNRG